MKIKTSELTGAALNWAVAKCEGEDYAPDASTNGIGMEFEATRYSTDWSQGGPIIECEAISLTQFSDYPKWTAKHPESICIDGPTPLIAAMRCYVAYKLGDEVDIPDELTQDN